MLDRWDKALLKILQSDSRLTNQELAERVNLSASAVHRRVREMEKAGIIAKHVAIVDARKVDRKTVVFVEITLSGQSRETFEAFERAVIKLPSLLECHLMAGGADYLLKIIARDGDDFADLHQNYLARLPHVANMQSSFALKTVFRTTALPVE